ncbi:hypothetical protein [Thermus thalpophilus]|uniref:hypothetical protein n=1 Tax=Thermus thalpophilus TaxID=2908147 RepID=UPI001FA9EF2D|nr:hypothetical protein [Thermus thalpophilus]
MDATGLPLGFRLLSALTWGWGTFRGGTEAKTARRRWSSGPPPWEGSPSWLWPGPARSPSTPRTCPSPFGAGLWGCGWPRGPKGEPSPWALLAGLGLGGFYVHMDRVEGPLWPAASGKLTAFALVLLFFPQPKVHLPKAVPP